MNSGNNMDVIPSCDVVQNKLDEACRHLNGGTNNQQGMPQYFRSVASEFAKVKDMVEKLEELANSKAISWQKSLNGNNSNINGGRRTKNKTRKYKK